VPARPVSKTHAALLEQGCVVTCVTRPTRGCVWCRVGKIVGRELSLLLVHLSQPTATYKAPFALHFPLGACLQHPPPLAQFPLLLVGLSPDISSQYRCSQHLQTTSKSTVKQKQPPAIPTSSRYHPRGLPSISFRNFNSSALTNVFPNQQRELQLRARIHPRTKRLYAF
jgi:hypothetical protein